MTENSSNSEESLDKVANESYMTARRVGLIAAFLVFGVFGVWAATAPIEGAAHAPGNVVVRSHTKVVQHLEGGIIAEILVDNGSRVQQGDPLLLLDTTQSAAELEMVQGQLVARRALEARLLAERERADAIDFPEDLADAGPDADAEMASQREIFTSRISSLQGRTDMLTQRAEQLEARITGMRALQESKQTLMASYGEELEEVRGLLADGFSDTNRLRQVSRNHDTLRGEVAELDSEIISTEGQIREARMEIEQIHREFDAEVVTQLGETRTELNELRERHKALKDVVDRQVVRAPDSGIVNGLGVHTVGAVISPGDPIAEIVPEQDELIIEARVNPIDIDRVTANQEASVRFSSLSAQTVPRVTGTVLHVSADAMHDEQNNTSYYLARVMVDPQAMEEIEDLILIPGMPADVFINSGARTLLQYLMKPLTSAMSRSFIED
ncbi:MAG: HlyD family type I secretion periplasmic adaptor subunit [Pseudomonadota bacterium]